MKDNLEYENIIQMLKNDLAVTEYFYNFKQKQQKDYRKRIKKDARR